MSPTPLDRMMHSRNAFFAFTGMIMAVSAWAIMSDTPIFPPAEDPKGNPEEWTESQLRQWLKVRRLEPSGTATREELLERVKLNLRRQAQAS